MTSGIFIAKLPQKLRAGDKVLIKGIADDNKFDILFANGIYKCEDNVTYRLKCILGENSYLAEYKKGTKWDEYNPTKLKINTFEYQFEFHSNSISVNLGKEKISNYPIKGDICEIESVQVHGNVKVNELTMAFK